MPAQSCILLVGHMSKEILYGAELSFLDNLRSLVSLGHKVAVIIPNDDSAEYVSELLKYTDQIYYLDIPWHLREDDFDEVAIARICTIARSCEAQLIISNTVTLREPLIAARRVGIPAVCSVREVPVTDGPLVKVLQKEPQQIVDEIHQLSDYVIANSQFTLNRYYLDGRSAIVRNTFDEKLLTVEKRLAKHLRIGYVASISREKGFEDFLEIARHFEGNKNFIFQVYGESNEYLQAYKAKALPKNLELKSYVRDTPEIFQEMDILLQLSQLEESFSRATIEAMAAATAVISYQAGALPELITHEATGLLVPKGDVDQVEKSISFLARNRKDLARLALNARHFARSNFSPASQREDFRKVLEVLLPDERRLTQAKNDFHIQISDVNRSHFKDPFLVGNRARLGTATCVRFTSDNQFVVASLLGQQLHLYNFDYLDRSSKKICTTDTINGKNLVSVDLFDFNGKNQLLTANCEDSSVSTYLLKDDAISFVNSQDVSTSGINYLHGARFIPSVTNKFAACGTAGEKGISFFDFSSRKRRGFFAKNGWGVKDMSMLDSTSNKFIAVMTKNNVGQDQRIEHEIQLLLVQGNRRLTKFKILSEYLLPNESIEGIIVRNGYLLVTCQSADSITVFSLHNDAFVMIDVLLGFSFPHGVDISPDGKLMAVANYGTCSVSLREIAFPTTFGSLAIT